MRRFALLAAGVLVVPFGAAAFRSLPQTAVPTTLADFFLPGSQPGQSGNLESPDKCDNCHGGFNAAIEPAFNWRGSMMSQAARDPLFFAALAIAEQDAPASGDMCLRCHTPGGWLAGRSSPTSGSALTAQDRESVDCDFCHRLVKPTPLGINPYPTDAPYTAETYPRDQAYLANLSPIPSHSANGSFIVDSDLTKRGPFVDGDAARHPFFVSPFHRESALCGTCHDVSNPAFDHLGGETYAPNAFGQPAPSFDPHNMFPVERTFTEWSLSAYNTPGGVPAPQFGGNKTNVSTCEDCHMHDVTGVACNKTGAVLRTDQPLHDLTGGNTFLPPLVQAQYPSEVNASALAAGVARARGMLQKAASLGVTMEQAGGPPMARVSVTNETAHKLPSGYPEGRRIWIQVRAYDATDALVFESGAYDTTTAVLDVADPTTHVYQIEPGVSRRLAPVVGVPAGPSFHFVLNDTIWSDNRIPPRGFSNAAFAAAGAGPIGYSYADGQYADTTTYTLPEAARRVEARLYYQTLSKEYVTFLRDANTSNASGQALYDLWLANGRSRPELMAFAADTLDVVVGVPGSPGGRLALAGVWPNPSRTGFTIAYTLPGRGIARLELIDARGRRIWARQAESTGAGDQRLQVDASDQPPPGVYLLRLVYEGAIRSRKIVLR